MSLIGRGLEGFRVFPLAVPKRYLGVGINENHRGQDDRLIVKESIRSRLIYADFVSLLRSASARLSSRSG